MGSAYVNEKIKPLELIRDELCKDFSKKVASLKDPTDPFFGCDFIDQAGALPSLLEMIQKATTHHPQERFMIGLVQATLTGKTRLLLEVSLKRPLIIIAFKVDNDAFNSLWLDLLHLNPCGSSHSKSFDERLQINSRMFLLVRLFFLAYLDFVNVLLGERKWDSISIKEKKAIFALLINGGGANVLDLYRLRCHEFDVKNTTELKEVKAKIIAEHRRVSKQLSDQDLCWGLDECHIPTHKLKGYFFHSDYKERLEHPNGKENLLRWQQYEGDTAARAPVDYPYKAPTSLFSAFRYLGEELTQQNNQVFLFASTYFSCWESILDESAYSRQKLKIASFTQFNFFSSADLLTIVQRHHPHPDIFRDQEYRFDLWKGRPGMFFQHLWNPYLCHIRQAKEIADAFKNAENTASTQIQEFFNSIHNRKNSGGHGVTPADTWNYFVYRTLLHGGVVEGKWIQPLVSAGLLLLRNEEQAELADPLVLKQVLNLEQPTNLLNATTALLKEPIATDKLAEYAIALNFLSQKSKTVSLVLQQLNPWNEIPEEVDSLLKRFVFSSEWAASVKDLGISHPFSSDSPLWKCQIVFPQMGLRLPDLSVIAPSQKKGDNSICMISAQIKHWESKLKDETLGDAVLSTSFPSFCCGSSNFETVQQDLKTQLASRKVFHLRLIICWAGFTPKQVKLFETHNQKNPDQPIFAIAPTLGVGPLIYGSMFDDLRKKTHLPKTKKGSSPEFEEVQLNELFMELDINSKWDMLVEEEE